MVTEFGMTVAKGPPDSVPLAQPTSDYALSDQTRREVDLSAQELASMAYARARRLMEMNRRCLDDLAANALERETLTREDLDEIFDAHDLHRTLVPGKETPGEELEDELLGRDAPGALLPQRSSEERQREK
jgi:ATP-dependent Zn protease